MLVCETPILITQSLLIIGMITDRKLTLSGLTLLYFNDKCWVHDYTQYTCFSVTDISLRPAAPIREVLLYILYYRVALC